MSLLAKKQQDQLEMLAIHRDKLLNDEYSKVPISQLESVKKEPKLKELIEKGLVPLEIDEYKKEVFIYALITRINDTKLKEYRTKVVVQSFDPSYIKRMNTANNKVDLFSKFDDAFLLHDPTAKPKTESKSKTTKEK